MKNALTYEIMTPESVGLSSNNIVLGKHSGRHALQKHCAVMGVHLEGKSLEDAYTNFLQVADTKKVVDQADLRKILIRGGWLKQQLPQIAIVPNFQV